MQTPYAILFLALAAPASAGEFTVQLTVSGKPVADAVASLHAVGRVTPRMRIAGPYRVSQKDTAFHPFVSIVPIGTEVSFPNFDPFRHHVYSFSAAKRFELKLYARDQSRTARFDSDGVVALGCNIHDRMSAFIFVTDSVWTTSSGPGGAIKFGSVPPGRYTLDIWHPYMRTEDNRIHQTIDIGVGDTRISTSVTLRTPPMHDMSGY